MPEKFPTRGVKSIAQIRGKSAAIKTNIPKTEIYSGLKLFDFVKFRPIFMLSQENND